MADLRTEQPAAPHTDVVEWLHLAEKLREHSGGELDETAIQAVSEVSGAPIELVRLAVLKQQATVPEPNVQKTVQKRIRTFVLSLDPTMRQIVLAATAGAGAGVFFALDRLLVRAAGLPAILAVIAIGIGVYFASEAREKRTAVLAGALGGLMAVVSRSFLLAIINIFGYNFRSSSEALVMLTGAGALFGLIAWNIRNKRRSTTGQTFQVDMQTEDRRKLLSQLVEIQDRLRAGEQTMSFMSVDVVGSTAMKEFADPLAIEYTFGEYHEFVEKITLKYGGNIHSTAGDGVLCAFETPAQAFAAARNLQSGIFEVNTYRNKLGKPIALRIGIHHGAVVPQGAGLQSINFAHVIDVAAHLQKAAPEGGIAISTPAAGMLPAAEAMRGAETIEVQNVKALIWRPKSTPSAPTFETPPIPPTP